MPPGCPPGKRSIWSPAAPAWVFPTPCVAESTRGVRGAQAARTSAQSSAHAPRKRRMDLAFPWQAFGVRAAQAAHGFGARLARLECARRASGAWVSGRRWAGGTQAGDGRRIGRAGTPVVATFRAGRFQGHCFRFARNERSRRSQSKLTTLQRSP